MARSLSSRSGGLRLPERVWVTTTKFAVVDHTRSGQYVLPAIARSGNRRLAERARRSAYARISVTIARL